MTETINFLGFVIGVIGIILAIYSLILQHKSIRIKMPVYSIKSNNLISGSKFTLKKLNITYGDEDGNQKIQNLTVTKVLFYNQGAETITGGDIKTDDPIRIIAKQDVKILDASILKTNFPSSGFPIPSAPSDYAPVPVSEGKEALICFKYLDKNHGAVYQIIHTGLSSQDIEIVGNIQGVEKLTKVNSQGIPKDAPMTIKDKVFILVMAVSTIIYWYLRIFTSNILGASPDNLVTFILSLIISMLGLGGTAYGLGAVLLLGYRFLFIPDYKFPKGLEIFLE